VSSYTVRGAKFRRTASTVLMAAAALAASVLWTGLLPSADAATSQITVGLTSLSPSFAVSDSTVHLTGDVTVPAHSAGYTGIQIELKIAPLSVRSEMTAGPGSDDQWIYGHTDQLSQVAAGTSADWSFSAAPDQLGLTSPGVYALDVIAVSDGDRIGALRTYLPYEVGGSSSTLKPTHMVLLWPLTGPPELDGSTQSQVVEATDDNLADQVGSGGRLDQMLTAAAAQKGITFSWLVDPNLLTTLTGESSGYVLYPDGAPGSQPQGAAQWLTKAKDLLKSNGELWQLPATDPDVASLAQADAGDARTLLAASVALNGDTVDTTLGRAPLGTLVWPADGQADPATLALAQTINPAATVVQSDSVALKTPEQRYTATGITHDTEGGTLAVSDSALDQVFAGDPADAAYQPGSDSGVLAAQRFLAQTALIVGESPSLTTPRTIMVTAPRNATPDPDLLAAVGSAPWLQTVGLSDLLKATPDPRATVGSPVRARATAATDLPAPALAQTVQLNTDLQQLTDIMTDPKPVKASYGPAVLSTVSTAWRTTPTATRNTYVDAATERLDQLIGAVSLVPKSDLTLSGKSGTIPFTVTNRLGQSVQVKILVTTNRDGLTFQTQQVRTVAEGSTTVVIPAQASVTGVKITVTAQLVAPTGQIYGAPVSFQVTVSSIGTTALIVLGLSAAVLVVAVGLRIYRGKRRRGPDGADADASAAADRENPAVTP
jgi:Family of unknown function (DUF6049)